MNQKNTANVKSKPGGVLCISLDFELIWGLFESRLSNPADYFAKTRASIPRVLDLFVASQISTTWGCVGMLFHHDWDDWQAQLALLPPSYQNFARDSYAFAARTKDSLPDHCFFAPDFIDLILATPGQEVASHTYSHFYCYEPGQTAEQFASDLQAAVTVAQKRGIKLESFIFPRNQFFQDYLPVCQAVGIRNVRTNPDTWYWHHPNQKLSIRCARTLDCYGLLSPKGYSWNQVECVSDVVLQAASRFLRPHHPRFAALNYLRTRRVMKEMTHAARNGLIYHLWWHPHNFAANVEESLKNLESILRHFCALRTKYGFRSATMKDIGDEFRQYIS